MSNASRHAIRTALNQVLGEKYEILEWIGGGGMAEVFLARHRAHGGLFAVKVLAEALADEPEIVARFMDEARTAATLGGHPNIAPVYDVGEWGSLHWLIMPYIEGEDLKSYLERHGRLSPPEAVSIIRQVAEALAWAGERRFVHRDLKPANIRIDLSGRVIVLDFGIAKAGDAPSARTRAGETLGTPYYMSPEQIRAEPCDHRSDLYSLGVIFFELLTGMKPFTGDSFRAIEIGHCQKAPPALSTLVPDIDPELERIVSRLLEKDREKRYSSARELLDDLRRSYRLETEVRLQPVVDRPDLLEAARSGAAAEPAPAAEAPPAWQPGAPERRQTAPAQKSRVPLLAGAALAVVAAVSAGIYFVSKSGDNGPKSGKAAQKAESASRELPQVIQREGVTMFLVPEGTFVFGDDSPESPNRRQELRLPAFYMDATEVSNAQYARFVQATGHAEPSSEDFRSSPSLPVTHVTLADARAYCAWAGKRLPTEQEWEKAGRGTDGRIYPWGNQPMPNPGTLVPVDDYPERQSPYRILGLAGNVFEWVDTPFPATEREIEDLRRALGGGEVSREWYCIKGGSFLLKDDRFFRLYMRRGWPAGLPHAAIGFRCVKDAQ
ncbi:MAG: bifunctional serine/threonine-protein kinase/formylglycine-generating enzyme family protein [Bryobacteraceae bacterium]|nr:bifunctional serine/threonine-protein kinase/formylglycine-generating enzyme family protein [Bryobacteraceae bacterium]